MSSESFLYKMEKLNHIALIREAKPFGRFVISITYFRVNQNCKFLDIKRLQATMDYDGKNFPMCINPEVANMYANDGREILTCKGCSFCEENNNKNS